MKLINIGFGNMVSADRLVAIVSPESAPIRRIISKAKESNMLIDATYGRRSRSVLVTDSDHVILSSIQPETIANRVPLALADQVLVTKPIPEGAWVTMDCIKVPEDRLIWKLYRYQCAVSNLSK